MATILISYRRSDSKGISGRIFDKLSEHFGAESLFMDVDNIPFGIDFREHIADILARSDILIAVVGPDWAGRKEDGTRRIDDEADLVRVEVEAALQRGIPVIPVLVDGAPMPPPSDLPESLKSFAFRNAAEIDTGRDFHAHMDRLIRSMEQLIGKSAAPVPGKAPSVRRPGGDIRFEPPGSRQPAATPVAAPGVAAAPLMAPAGFVVRWRGTLVLYRVLAGFAIAFALFCLLELLILGAALGESDERVIFIFRQWTANSLPLQLLLQVVILVLFLVWTYRSTANLIMLGAGPLTYTPGWAVGWYLIPIANIWMGFAVMSQLWRASFSLSSNEPGKAVPARVWGWWLLLLAWTLLTIIGEQVAQEAATVETFRTGVKIYLAGTAAAMIASESLIMIVRSITRQQYAAHAARAMPAPVPASAAQVAQAT